MSAFSLRCVRLIAFHGYSNQAGFLVKLVSVLLHPVIIGVVLVCSWGEEVFASPPGESQTYLSGENLVYPMPEGWQVGYDNKTKKHRMTGLIPESQQLESWKDMLSVQVVFNAARKDPSQFIDGMALAAEKACPGSKGKVLEEGEQQGYHYLIWYHDCQKNPRTQQVEISLLKAMQGSDHFYVIQRAWRSVPGESDLDTWSAYLKETAICDTRFKKVACPK